MATPREQLEALRRQYIADLPDKIRSLEEAADRLKDGGCDRADVEALYHQAHRMTGSAAIYGFLAISSAAEVLERLATDLLHGRQGPDRPGARLAASVGALREAFQRGDGRGRG